MSMAITFIVLLFFNFSNLFFSCFYFYSDILTLSSYSLSTFTCFTYSFSLILLVSIVVRSFLYSVLTFNVVSLYFSTMVRDEKPMGMWSASFSTRVRGQTVLFIPILIFYIALLMLLLYISLPCFWWGADGRLVSILQHPSSRPDILTHSYSCILHSTHFQCYFFSSLYRGMWWGADDWVVSILQHPSTSPDSARWQFSDIAEWPRAALKTTIKQDSRFTLKGGTRMNVGRQHELS